MFRSAIALSIMAVACHAQIVYNFDDVAVGKIPEAWTIEATVRAGDWNEPGRENAPLGEWKVVTDASAPSGNKALSLTRIGYDPVKFEQIFNVCWTKQTQFLDGEITVRMKYGTTGKIDQGGGIIWRVKDKNNYYLARYNPLESTGKGFCVYAVKDAYRYDIKRLTTPATNPSEWHTIRITHKGSAIEGYFNGQKYFSVTDTRIMDNGGVGLWTKADALSSFDDLTVTGGKTSSLHPTRTRAVCSFAEPSTLRVMVISSRGPGNCKASVVTAERGRFFAFDGRLAGIDQ